MTTNQTQDTNTKTPNNKNNIQNPHDKLFKYVFTKKHAVSEFIEKFLPTHIAKRINTDSLILDNNEYVDDKLRTHYSDVVYQAKYATDEDNASIHINIAILFEHKSYADKHPHLQLMRYLLNIWETQIKQKQPLMPVIPIIFYHGQSNWLHQALKDYFIDNPVDDTLQHFLPSFDYLLMDTSQYDNDYLKQLNPAELRYSILSMKYIMQMEQFFTQLTDIFSDIDQFISTERGRKFFQTMVIYLYQHSDLTAKQWGEKMRTVSAQAQKSFVSTYDQAIMSGMEMGIEKGRQEGRQEGILQGMERGMQKGMQMGKKEGIQEGLQKGKFEGLLTTAKNLKAINLDINSIAQVTGLSIDEIDKL